ncbi:peptidase S28 [Dentipellis sp. KUC8613]|nr:peptidase S28 [Dentipellis sp. KUC8613]
MLFAVSVLIPLIAWHVSARILDGRLHANMPPMPLILPFEPPSNNVTQRGASMPPLNTTYYFDQLVDHTNAHLGTFKQRFWMDWEYYEPGGPILMFTPGENNAENYTMYLTNGSIFGMVAQQEKGATVLIEHRFFGFSNPYPDLTVASLKYLTIQQAIDDLAYFAENANLPMPGGDNVAPDKAPWVLLGGSYSGALPSFVKVNKPDVFWAGYASSGVVQSIVDFWEYFDIIRQFMPQNCSADVQAVVQHFDRVFTSGNQSAVTALKDAYGMKDVSHLDDVAGALRNNLWDWQKLSPLSGPGSLFFQFCDALEVKDGRNAPASGWGVEHAVGAWGAYFKNTYMNLLCGDMDVATCIGTYNASASTYTDTAVNNAARSWQWIVCNEMGFFQDAAPTGMPSIVSQLIQPMTSDEAFTPPRQCAMMFPEAFAEPRSPNVQKTNKAYHGWDVKADRLFFANGRRDPWRGATVSSDSHTVASTPSQPIVVSDGFHFSELRAAAGDVDPTIKNVQMQALSHMHTWMEEWRSIHGGR